MRIKKIVLVVSNYFTYRDYKRFGVETLEANNFLVEVWDLSHILSPKVVESIKKTSLQEYSVKVKRFFKMKEVFQEIRSQEKDTFFITMIMYSFATFLFFKSLSKNNFDYGATGPYTFNFLPQLVSPSKTTNSLFNKSLKKIFFGVLNRFVSNSKMMRLLKIEKGKVFFASGGSKVFAKGPLIGSGTVLKRLPSADYDFFSSIKEKEVTQEYVLFLDQYLPFHPDFVNSQHKSNLSIDVYYSELRQTFDQIEEKTGKKVVIGAHPKAYYHDKEHLFGNRKIFHNVNSFDLVRKAEVILMHFSMGVSMPVLFDKPILFLTSDSFSGTYFDVCTRNLAKWFGTKPINMTDKIDDLQSFFADSELYGNYEDEFLKPRLASNELFWKQVADYIKKV